MKQNNTLQIFYLKYAYIQIKHFLKYVAYFNFLILICPLAFADNSTEQNLKSWTTLSITGPLTDNKVIQYYLDTQLKLINRNNPFDQALANVGLGYQCTQDLSFWLGNTWVISNDPIEDEADHEYRIWEQISWNATHNFVFDLLSRTRLEERKDIEAPQMAVRLRQKTTLNIPIATLKNYYFVLWDEIFFNLNHPMWVTNQVIDQNRAFIGIAIPTSERTSLEMGYLNQFLFRSTNQMNHVFYLNLKIKTD